MLKALRARLENSEVRDAQPEKYDDIVKAFQRYETKDIDAVTLVTIVTTLLRDDNTSLLPDLIAAIDVVVVKKEIDENYCAPVVSPAELPEGWGTTGLLALGQDRILQLR